MLPFWLKPLQDSPNNSLPTACLHLFLSLIPSCLGHRLVFNSGNLYKIFEGVLGLCNDYRKSIIKTIDVAELNEDYEVKIKLEEFLLMFEPYRKQADIWFKYAERYKGDDKSFDVHFEDVTVLIDKE